MRAAASGIGGAPPWLLKYIIYVIIHRKERKGRKVGDFLIYSRENESWQRKLTTEDTESRCFSLCSSVYSVVFQTIPEDNKKSHGLRRINAYLIRQISRFDRG
jgi:hypothetical protein